MSTSSLIRQIPASLSVDSLRKRRHRYHVEARSNILQAIRDDQRRNAGKLLVWQGSSLLFSTPQQVPDVHRWMPADRLSSTLRAAELRLVSQAELQSEQVNSPPHPIANVPAMKSAV